MILGLFQVEEKAPRYLVTMSGFLANDNKNQYFEGSFGELF